MIYVYSVNVYPKHITLEPGKQTFAVRAEVCPSEAACKDILWSSEDPSVASVDKFTGVIFAKSIGNTKIYATASDGSGCSDCINICVSKTIPIGSVSLDRSNISIEEGHFSTLFAAVYPFNASNKDLFWRSSDPNVAIVNGGVVSAVSKGSAKIIATAIDGSGKSSSCLVTVTKDIPIKAISVTSPCKRFTPGISSMLYANIYPKSATEKFICWSSSDTKVVTVDRQSGMLCAHKVGSATVYATACDGSGVVGKYTVKVDNG